MKRINVVILIVSLFTPLIVGGISSYLSSAGMAGYGNMDKPPLSPPGWVFPLAWTILYLMMGLASYFIIVSEVDFPKKAISLIVYAIQLFMNFMWSIIFFNREEYLIAFVWLIFLLLAVILCVYGFYSISKIATYLMIPYALWLVFAAYLNWGAYALSR